METWRIIFSGSGGQGIITAAIILAEAAAIHEGLEAVQSQVYGPEARGGATRSDVVISDKPIDYFKVIHPNVLVCLTQEAYNQYAGIIRPGGLCITDSHFVKLNSKVDARQKELAMYEAVRTELGNPIVLNICMLGAFVQLTQVVRSESILKVLAKTMKPDLLELNQKALALGVRLATE